MRFIRVHGFAAVPARGAMGYRTPAGLFARQAWTPVPAPSHPHRDLNPGDRTENPAGCHYLMGASVVFDRTQPARSVRDLNP